MHVYQPLHLQYHLNLIHIHYCVLWGCWISLIILLNVLCYFPKNCFCWITGLQDLSISLIGGGSDKNPWGEIEILISWLYCFSVYFYFDLYPTLLSFLFISPFLFLSWPPSPTWFCDSNIWWWLIGFLLSSLMYPCCWILCI